MRHPATLSAHLLLSLLIAVPPALGQAPLKAVTVTAGSNHSCALTPAGLAYCWGDNHYGQLGDGDTLDSAVPVPVAGGRSFTSLGAGALHTCGMTKAGKIYCWGNNSDGQLGDYSTDNASVPVAVQSTTTFATLIVGLYTNCVLTSAGAP
ncbi:MAG TPA: hypothetical protein VLT17_08080, partial [Gemmatimonadales bacterium]|nr:hypothetical protein [Gemmatimonadales bacterium]